MTSAEALNSVFREDLEPDFPFQDSSWIAVAFERNAYDNTRMPEWFFQTMSKHFGDFGKIALLIAGDCFAGAGLPAVCPIPFEWESYRTFMLRPETYSVEYRMTSTDMQCGCWADADITLFGGTPVQMSAVLDELGGPERLLHHMRQEFLLGDVDGYDAMDKFFQRLLFPSKRGE
ncbi:MAG TPA: hypothetical protein VLF15_04040 [Pseudoxanthomonas sp.]|nr:hypothetical protein [Pseudoxanthomonas sp.]